MNRIRGFAVFALVMGLGGTLAPHAHAQAAAADALFNQGRDAVAKGDLATACARFRASDKLDPAAGTKLNLAACEEKRGKIASAWEMFKAAVDQLPAGDDRIAIAKQRIAELAPRLPHLTVKLPADAPEGTTVKDGEALMTPGSFGVPLPVDPGVHHFMVTAPGHAARTYDVALVEKDNKTIDVEPGPATASGAPAPTSGAVTADTGGSGSNKKTLGYVVGGVGVAGLAVGAVTGIMVLGKKSTANDHCNDQLQLCDQTGKDANDAGRTLGTISTIGWVVGVAGVGLGTYFILTSNGKSETALATHVGPTVASVALTRSW